MALIERLKDVQRRISGACDASGRDASEVRLLPVSKTHPIGTIEELLAAGLTSFAENRLQELAEKAQQLPGAKFSMIGPLQRNKAKLLAEHAAEFQALDSVRIAEALDRRLQAVGRGMDVLVQVNTSSEPQKGGIDPLDAIAFAASLAPFHSLRVRGLMTIAINSPNLQQVGACFDRLVETQTQLRESGAPGQWDELSMGMSGDFELAIERGATCVRIGTALFGAR